MEDNIFDIPTAPDSELGMRWFCSPLSRQEVPECMCATYLASLASLNIPISVTVRGDIDNPIMLDINGRNVVASGLNMITQWLSYRQGASEYLRILCGRTKEERRAVSRAIKRVNEWKFLWEDITTHPEVKLESPMCPFLLFDKKIRHRLIRYITQYTHNDAMTRTVDAISAADILLVSLMSDWLRAFEVHKMFLKATIPSLITYVASTRNFLREVNAKLFGNSQCGIDVLLLPFWVDDVVVSSRLDFCFRFTCKDLMQRSQKVSESDADRVMTKASVASSVRKAALFAFDKDCTVDNDVLAIICNRLIGQLDWPSETDNYEVVVDDGGVDARHQQGTQVEEPLQELISPSPNDLKTVRCFDPNTPLNLSDPSSDYFWEVMNLPNGREKRKRQQIMSQLEAADSLIPEGGLAVEFCCGGGYVGIPLAVMRPDITVILTDMNSVSLNFAKQRINRLKLKNVHIKLCELSYIDKDISIVGRSSVGLSASTREFDLGLALHACGGASDTVLRICRDAGASFVVSPCCYGFIKHTVLAGLDMTAAVCGDPADSPTNKEFVLEYPLSAAFRNAGWKSLWFAQLCSQADRTFWTHDDRSVVHNNSGRLAMKVIDSDRLLKARESGFCVEARYMSPFNASPKNHILVGDIH